MPIKMGVNKDKDSVCKECGVKWENTKEMYNIKLAGNKFTICAICSDELFKKLLKASCMYNERLKSKEDQERINNSNKIRGVI